MKHFEFSTFEYSGWDRPRHTVLRDATMATDVYRQGFHVVERFLDRATVDELLQFYHANHSISAKDGGFFVSIYSKDLAYRRMVHDFLLKQLEQRFDLLFREHKYTCLNYAAKYPGQRGELFVHQDMAQVNEMEHSQVGVWIPLVDVSLDNGTLGIIPFTHFTIPPHRSLYHDLPYSKLYDVVVDYMQPLNLKAGDLLLFDIRLLHNSFINRSDQARISIATSVVPASADFCMTYKNENDPTGHYELLKLKDDFYLTFKDFKSEKVAKPGTSTGTYVTINEAFATEEDFLSFCQYHQLPRTGMGSYRVKTPIESIEEPVHVQIDKDNQQSGSFWQKIKRSLRKI